MASVKSFSKLKPADWQSAGGKGGNLARLTQSRFPVPDGFVILPDGFRGDELIPQVHSMVHEQLARLRKGEDGVKFAVRSSALSEDSARDSFAGEFETVLGLVTDEEITQAVHKVRLSRRSQRVQVYSQARGVDPVHEMAVVVQRMVPAEISGVLFTADPVSGSRAKMVGSFVPGLGDQLVAGESSGQDFSLVKPDGAYVGPVELRPYASALYKLALRLEKELGSLQDIEWAIESEQVYLLQARPITTLRRENSATGEWNASLDGDFLWSNVNFGEAVTSVLTPFSWSVLRYILKDWMNLAGYHPVGNICGRPYLNISLFATALYMVGKTQSDLLDSMESTLFMDLPNDIQIPVLPLSIRERLSALPGLLRSQLRQQRGVQKLPSYLSSNPAWCRAMRAQVQGAESHASLLTLWREEIEPHVLESAWIVLGSAMHAADYTMALMRELTPLVGAEDAQLLVSSLSNRAGKDHDPKLLLSLGPLVGLTQVAGGELEREKYLEAYGHRGPDEFELSVPRPAEDPAWLDQKLKMFTGSGIDVRNQLVEQQNQFENAWERLQAAYPRRAKKMGRRINEVVPRSHLREVARSEYVRDRWLIRTFAVRAGDLTGIGDDIFFLTIQEVLNLLAGDPSAMQYIPARKDTHSRYSALPPYPSIIRGTFNPFRWAQAEYRRSDYYDSTTSEGLKGTLKDQGCMITGAAGSAGTVEGLVRCLTSAEQGDNLQTGEILVTTQTDIAWTLLFPRAAAIVTDVGAPLSHAAIVARELGIPAVVGCGDATMRLKTGDRVRVDGGHGIVEIL